MEIIKINSLHQLIGIKGKAVIMDIDGTLVPDGRYDVSKKQQAIMAELMRDNSVFLSTNSRKTTRADKVSQLLNLPVLSSKYRKPNPKVIAEVPKSPRQKIIVVGDKYLTDGRLAKKCGLEFFKIRRLIDNKERLVVKLIYRFDDLAYWFVKALGMVKEKQLY